MEYQKGHIIGGRFRIDKLIGKGGMGSVYEARHLSLPRTYAIKILLAELATDEGFIERFRREAIAMSRIDHPNVIRITDFGHTDDGSVYLVMEYLDGDGLDDVLSRRVRLPVERALSILAQIADALEVAHQEQVVHRDLKPENILLTERHGRKDFVKLLDFGIAKVRSPEFDGTPLTIQGEVFGTAEYMSPEQATGRPQDGRSDIYALGCLLYELITGEPPFCYKSAVEVLKAHVFTEPVPPSTKMKEGEVLPDLDRLVMRCLAKEPVDRFQSCAALRQELVRVRASSYSLSGEMAHKSRITGRLAMLSAKQMSSGWQPLGGKVPQIMIPFSESTLLMDEPESEVDREAPTAPAPSEEETRRKEDARHGLVRQLALAMLRNALAPDETSKALERLLVVEEELAEAAASHQSLEQSFNRLHFDTALKERPLRRAMAVLAQEMIDAVDVRGQAGADVASADAQIKDLEFQIGQLDNSSLAVVEERDTQLMDLNRELTEAGKRRSELTTEAGELITAIGEQLRAMASDDLPAEIQSLFVQFTAADG